MLIPDFSREEKLFNKGYRNIAGIDEAGRGPLAGPVVAAAVVFSSVSKAEKLLKLGVKDSKMLSGKKRDYLYGKILEQSEDWASSAIYENVIDEINILQATKLAMKEAVNLLKIKPDFLLIDGQFTLEGFPISQIAIPKGDKLAVSVSAASIIAKVTRDRILDELDEQFPEYGFAKNKGYGTKDHIFALMKNGPCKAHRKTFNPVGKILEGFNKKNLQNKRV